MRNQNSVKGGKVGTNPPFLQRGEKMIMYYLIEILQTQAFDVLIQTVYMVAIWALITYRLDRIEEKI